MSTIKRCDISNMAYDDYYKDIVNSNLDNAFNAISLIKRNIDGSEIRFSTYDLCPHMRDEIKEFVKHRKDVE